MLPAWYWVGKSAKNMVNPEINISGMITTFSLLLQKNGCFAALNAAKQPIFCSLLAHGAGKKGEAELNTNDTFKGYIRGESCFWRQKKPSSREGAKRPGILECAILR
jgi:hypothetical protein